MAPSNDRNENYVVHLKEQSLVKKVVNLVEIDQQTATQSLFELCSHQTHSAPDSELDQKNKHIFTPTAGARSTIFPKLRTVIELVVRIKKGVIHF